MSVVRGVYSRVTIRADYTGIMVDTGRSRRIALKQH